jgi:predicted RNA-binding protein (virulence factor B family)
MTMAHKEFLKKLPNFYYGRLTNRQWRLIVSALSEMGTEEADRLARDLLLFVVPPHDN